MISNADLKLISTLRLNARENLTTISKKTNIPISTLYEKLKRHEQSIILKHTTLLDFSKIGYLCRAQMLLLTNKENRDQLASYLKAHLAVNNIYKINNGYDFLVEGIFTDIKQLEDFLEELENKFPLEQKKIHYIIEDIKRESFLTFMI